MALTDENKIKVSADLEVIFYGDTSFLIVDIIYIEFR